jgi:hypothetical protein
MTCPHCGKEAKIESVVFYNVEAYGKSATGRTDCCGKGVLVSRVVSFKLAKPYKQEDTDDWGNKLEK